MSTGTSKISMGNGRPNMEHHGMYNGGLQWGTSTPMGTPTPTGTLNPNGETQWGTLKWIHNGKP